MGTWQLFVDETGKFGSHDALAVGGWLYEGYASGQLAIAMRRAMDRIFVGVPYPAHAAHHNCVSTLLFAPLRGADPNGFSSRYSQRIGPAFDLAQRATSPEAVRLREAVASGMPMYGIDLESVWWSFDRWLARAAPAAHAALASEADAQRADFVDFLATQLAGPLATRAHLLVGAWKPSGGGATANDAKGDGDYVELFESVLERALAFVASRDGEARLFVHVAKRPWSTRAGGAKRLLAAQRMAAEHPLLTRAKRASLLVGPDEVSINEDAHPGFVVADFVANRLRRALAPYRSWADVAGSVNDTTGLSAVGSCSLVETRKPLPALTGTGADRSAVKSAARGEPVELKVASVWCREQAGIWVSAITEAP